MNCNDICSFGRIQKVQSEKPSIKCILFFLKQWLYDRTYVQNLFGFKKKKKNYLFEYYTCDVVTLVTKTEKNCPQTKTIDRPEGNKKFLYASNKNKPTREVINLYFLYFYSENNNNLINS